MPRKKKPVEDKTPSKKVWIEFEGKKYFACDQLDIPYTTPEDEAHKRQEFMVEGPDI
jgi:hypothetical protein